jgi:hypothetical protein
MTTFSNTSLLEIRVIFASIIKGVGKSSLLIQFTDNKFNEEMDATIGVEFGCQTVKI